MSYVRWSSPLPISEPCHECGRLPVEQYPGDEHAQAMACRDYQKRWAWGPLYGIRHSRIFWRRGRTLRHGIFARLYFWRQRGLCRSCTSAWYVYNDLNGKLAVWAAGVKGLYYVTYEEAREIVEADDYARIPGFGKWGGQGVLAACLKEAIKSEYATGA